MNYLCSENKGIDQLCCLCDTDQCLFHICKKHMSRVTRKPTICICENKDADQLRGNREADQRLCFGYIDSTIPLLSKSEISSLKPSSVAVQPGLCGTRSETRMLVFPGRDSYFFMIGQICTLSVSLCLCHDHLLNIDIRFLTKVIVTQ